MYLGFLICAKPNFWAWRASLVLPVSQSPRWIMSHLKYRAVGSFPPIRWVINLRCRLLLLPTYMMDFLALPSSYAPSFSGSFSRFARVNFCHLPFIGITALPFVIDSYTKIPYPLAKRLEARYGNRQWIRGCNSEDGV